MNNRVRYYFVFYLIIILLLAGCGKDVEIPVNEIGVVLVDKQATHVLTEGRHKVPADSEIVYYDKMPKQTEFDFDFLFNDSSLGYVKFSVSFEPHVDHLVDFYNTYHTTTLFDVVEVELKVMIRDLMKTYNRADLSLTEIENIISEKIKSPSGVLHFIKIVELTHIKVHV